LGQRRFSRDAPESGRFMLSLSFVEFNPWLTSQGKGTLLPARRRGLLMVEVPGEPNVPYDCACYRPARQFLPARASFRAADPARWIGRGRQCADQRRAIWPCQSQSPLRPQRHRKCLKPATAPQQHPATRGPLDTHGTGTGRHAAFLSGCVARVHPHACCRAKKQGTASPAGSSTGQLLHWHLPGMLARV
jgi:hypothetical protein